MKQINFLKNKNISGIRRNQEAGFKRKIIGVIFSFSKMFPVNRTMDMA